MTKRTRLLGLCAIVLCLSIAAGTTVAVCNTSGYAEQWSDVSIAEVYRLGESFTVPSRTVDGIVATSTVVLPDGNATRSTSLKLDQVGEYCVCYSAEKDGKVYSASQKFSVRQPLVSANKEETTYKTAYGNFAAYGVADGDGKPRWKEPLCVTLASNDRVTFNQYIDFSELTKEDPIIEFYIDPDTRGVAAFDIFYFQFTDVLNPDVYFTVRYQRYINYPGSAYASARGNNQVVWAGYESNTGKWHINDVFGEPVNCMLTAQHYNWDNHCAVDDSSDHYPIALSYDAGTRQLFTWNTTLSSTSWYKYITDLDDPTIYEDLWTGFPSGKAYMTIYGSAWNTGSANIHIKNIYGYGDLDNAWEKDVNDDVAPQLTVDLPSAMPEGRIGGTYTIPQATALDIYSGVCKVDTEVTYGDGFSVFVQDGKFITDKPGVYQIKYTTKDAYGNSAEKTVNIHAGNAVDEIAINLPQEKVTDASLGQYVAVPAPTSITGGRGNCSYTVIAKNGQTEIDVSNGGFYPEIAGNWTIEYTATDFTGDTEKVSYNLSVSVGNKPMLVDVITLPKYYLSSMTYQLPLVYANDYTSGKLERLVMDVEVTDANGTNIYKAGDKFVPQVDNQGDSVQIKFKSKGEVLAEYSIPSVLAYVSDGRYSDLQIQNYFVGEGFTIDKKHSAHDTPGIFVESNGSYSWEFAKDIASDGFAFTFGTLENLGAFSSIKFTLEDAENANIAVSFSIVKSGDTYVAKDNQGNVVCDLVYNFNSGSADQTVSFDGTKFKVNKSPFTSEFTDFGEKFDGFTAGKIYFKMQVTSAVATTVIARELNGYVFSSAKTDRIPPQIVVLGNYGGSYEQHSIYTVSSALANDVLDPNVTFTVTVTDPQGNFVTAQDGTVLDKVSPDKTYQIQLEKFGQYTVSYSAKDSGSSSNFSYKINILDGTAPEFHFEKGFRTTAKVGEVYYIPSYTLSDDISQADAVKSYKMIVNPNGAIVYVTGNAVKLEYAGEYQVRLVAYDEAGNAKFVTVTVTVTD